MKCPVLRIDASAIARKMEFSMKETNNVSPLRQRALEDKAALHYAIRPMRNSLKSLVGQNENSPVSNLHAITFKLSHRIGQIASPNHPVFASPPW